LNYDFMKGDPQQAASIALRFTLSVPGVHTAIIGTKNPTHWRENADLLNAGPQSNEQFEAIRAPRERSRGQILDRTDLIAAETRPGAAEVGKCLNAPITGE
jgi:diketogulonate reductase-like aldo/keto reductase